MRRWLPLCLLLPASPLAAQGYRLPVEWHWYVSAAGGFNAGDGATFNAIDAGLIAGGWTTRSAQCNGLPGCQGPAGNATRKRMAITIAARRAFGKHFQARFFGSIVRPGEYLGTSGPYRVTVRPASSVIAAQAVMDFGPAWIGAGPALDFARVTSGSAASPSTTKGVRPGVAVGAGFTFPQHKPLWLEVAVERRFIGSLDVPAVPVPAAPTIPAMSVPMSHSVLTFGVGWRFP